MNLAIAWVVGGITFIYGTTNLGPTHTDNNPLGFAFMAVGFGVPMFLTVKRTLKQAAARNALFLSTKALYEKALFDLQEDPENSQKHQLALEKGREYYSFLHPNTYDMNSNGGSSNYRDNSGIVEMKVQSDIQARVKKGKVS